MNVLSIAQQCCLRTKEPRISDLFNNLDNSNEWLGYIGQSSNQIASENEWSSILTDYEFTTAGGLQEYDLPSDFDSMKTYFIFNKTNNQLIFNESTDQYSMRVIAKNTSQSSIKFRLVGGKIKFTYPIVDGLDLIFSYISKNFVKFWDVDAMPDPAYVYRNEFLTNDDLFRINDELLILGAIYLRSLMNGFPDAQQRQADYTARLAQEIDKDGGKRRFNMFGDGIFFNKTTGTEYAQY